MTVLRFGRFRGVPLHLVPADYLGWCLGQAWIWPETLAAIRAELDERAAAVMARHHRERAQTARERQGAEAMAAANRLNAREEGWETWPAAGNA